MRPVIYAATSPHFFVIGLGGKKRQIFVHLRLKTLSCKYIFSPFFLKCIQFRCIKTNLGGERLLSQGRLGTKIHTCFQSWRFHTSFHAKRNMEVLLRKSWNSKKQEQANFLSMGHIFNLLYLRNFRNKLPLLILGSLFLKIFNSKFWSNFSEFRKKDPSCVGK